jgi:hypothetical protein
VFEMALRFPVPVQPLLTHLEQQGILGGIAIERFYPDAKNVLLITCTEMTLSTDIDRYVDTVSQYLQKTAPTVPPHTAPDYLEKMEATC